MATIHPKPRLAYLRDDGDGNLDLCITTSDGRLEVKPLKPSEIAQWINHLSAYAARELKKLEARP